MSEFGRDLVESANEALAIAEGRAEPARVIAYAPETVERAVAAEANARPPQGVNGGPAVGNAKGAREGALSTS